jgi:hypothetical protein
MLLHIKDGATAKLMVYENAAFPSTNRYHSQQIRRAFFDDLLGVPLPSLSMCRR